MDKAKHFSGSDKIGDIASRFPGSMEIFQKYNIDFCCGGNRPLTEAIKEQDLDEKKLLQEINQAYRKKQTGLREDIDWDKASLSELIEYIVNKHHAFLQKKLPEISELVTKILRVHGNNHGEILQKVHRLFHSLKMELEQHLIKEEEVLFPAIKEYEANPDKGKLKKTFSVINEVEDEHEGAGDILKEMRKITFDYNVPDDGCRTYELTFKLLEELEKDLFQHIHLENNILFPRLEREREKVLVK